MKLIAIIIGLVILQSCNDNSLEKVNLKEYFLNPDDFSKPKVFVHEVKTNDNSSLIYHQIEKDSANNLMISIYNANYDLTTILIDSFNTRGVTLKRMVYIENRRKLNVKLHSGLIFPFEKHDAELKVETILNDPTEQSYVIIDKHKWQLKELVDNDIIIAKGNQKRIFNDAINKNTDTINLGLEIWYKKGFGIIKHKSCNKSNCKEINYLRTISINEFNELKKNL